MSGIIISTCGPVTVNVPVLTARQTITITNTSTNSANVIVSGSNGPITPVLLPGQAYSARQEINTWNPWPINERSRAKNLMNPDCATNEWWTLAKWYPWYAVRSPLFGILTLETPERWVAMTHASIRNWIVSYATYLPGKDLDQFFTEALKLSLPLQKEIRTGCIGQTRKVIRLRRLALEGKLELHEYAMKLQQIWPRRNYHQQDLTFKPQWLTNSPAAHTIRWLVDEDEYGQASPISSDTMFRFLLSLWERLNENYLIKEQTPDDNTTTMSQVLNP